MAVSQFKATTAELLASIKARGNFPASQDTYTDEDLLQLADEELLTGLVPLILSTHEDYYTAAKDFAVSGVSYEIPTRSIGGKLRDVMCVTTQGEEYSVPRINGEDVQYNSTFAFYVRANRVIFTGVPQDTVRLYYHIRPSALIKSTGCGTISTLDATLFTADLSNVPSTYTVGGSYDIVSPNAPFKCKDIDLRPTNLAGTVLTFASLPDAAQGDYVCLAGQSPVVQLPYELIPVLAQRVAVKALEGQGDREAMQAAQGRLDAMERQAFKLLEPRVDGQPSKVINRNSSLRRNWR